MTAHMFVEAMRQETTRVLPIIIIPLMIAFICAVLECLSSRSYAKELNTRKYKRTLMAKTTPTKVDLERISKQSCKMNN